MAPTVHPEINFRANSSSPLKWTKTISFFSLLKKTLAISLRIYSEAGVAEAGVATNATDCI